MLAGDVSPNRVPGRRYGGGAGGGHERVDVDPAAVACAGSAIVIEDVVLHQRVQSTPQVDAVVSFASRVVVSDDRSRRSCLNDDPVVVVIRSVTCSEILLHGVAGRGR